MLISSPFSKENIFYKDEKVLVIADGAALYLPESFEWLILSAGVRKSSSVDKIIENPSEYVESKDYYPAYLNESIKDLILDRMKKE